MEILPRFLLCKIVLYIFIIMIKKIYLDCCGCRSFQFTWILYHDVLEELKDSFVSLFTSCETSNGCSTTKICRGPQSFFPFSSHSPLTVTELALLEDRKWGLGSGEVANDLRGEREEA